MLDHTAMRRKVEVTEMWFIRRLLKPEERDEKKRRMSRPYWSQVTLRNSWKKQIRYVAM